MNNLQSKVIRLEGEYEALKASISAIGERSKAAGRLMTSEDHSAVRRKMAELHALSLRVQEAKAIAAYHGPRWH